MTKTFFDFTHARCGRRCLANDGERLCGWAPHAPAMAAERCDTVARVLTAAHAFDALGLPAVAADRAAVKAAYRRVALAVHPDKSDDPRAEQAFKRLGEAYEVLQNPLAQAELLALCKSDFPRRNRGGKGGATTPRQPDATAHGQRDRRELREHGPHTTVYFRSAHEAREAARTAATDKKRQRDERATAVHRAEAEAKMQSESWGSSVKSWQSWTDNSSSKRRRGHMKPGDASSIPPDDVHARPSPQWQFCMLCRRQFKDKAALQRHEQHSQLHMENLRKQAHNQNQPQT